MVIVLRVFVVPVGHDEVALRTTHRIVVLLQVALPDIQSSGNAHGLRRDCVREVLVRDDLWRRTFCLAPGRDVDLLQPGQGPLLLLRHRHDGPGMVDSSKLLVEDNVLSGTPFNAEPNSGAPIRR